jgi:hypothetical protein
MTIQLTSEEDMPDIHWQRLQPFFKITFFRFFLSWFAIAPIFVKIVEKLPQPITVPHTPQPIVIHLGMPFNWWILWFGALAYLTAMAIYYVACPGFIKQYPSFADFRAEENSPRYLAHKMKEAYATSPDKEKLVERLLTKGYANSVEKFDDSFTNKVEVENRGSVFRFVFNGKFFELCVDENLVLERQRDLFWEIFEAFCARYWGWRDFVVVLLASAGICIAVVLGQQIWFVIAYLFR